MSIYNIDGQDILHGTLFADNMQLDYKFDESGNANYTVLRIYKTRIDGTKQYPFVYCPNGIAAGTKSTLEMNLEKNFFVAINAGYSDPNTMKPIGVLIQNGVALKNATESGYALQALTIDENGDLGYTTETNAQTLVNNGVVSACMGYPLLISNYEKNDVSLDANAQRQIIGQFGNGDYAVITCEGRDYDHSDGWTALEAQNICQQIGLKFAYMLDGGGGTETVIGKKQINTIYEGTFGRIVPTYIVFNGTDQFIA